MEKMNITVHAVLAGAYKTGIDNAKRLLLHASIDGGRTTLCKKVKADRLCDIREEGRPTCEICETRMAKLEATAPAYEAFVVAQTNLALRVTETSDALRAFPREGVMGLPTEAARLSPEYRAAKARYDRAFEAYRDFNGAHVPLYTIEIAAARDARRAGK